MSKTAGKKRVARWLEGKEAEGDYPRNTRYTNHWSLFFDLFRARFTKLMLLNLLVLVTLVPIFLVMVWRNLSLSGQGLSTIFGSGLLVGYPVIPEIDGFAEQVIFLNDLFFFGLFAACSFIAALGVSGGAYVVRNLVWTEGRFAVSDFIKGIKRNYWRTLEALLFFFAVLFAARTLGNYVNQQIASGVSGATAGWHITSEVFGYIFVGIAALISLWMISLGASYRLGPLSLLGNAVALTIGTFPQTVLFAALGTAPIILALFTGGFLMILLYIVLILFGFSYLLLSWATFSGWAFDRYVSVPEALKPKTAKEIKAAKKESEATASAVAEREAALDYKRMVIAQGKSNLVVRPMKPLDGSAALIVLPELFSREDLMRVSETRQAAEAEVRAYEEAHRDDERYAEYIRRFEERDRALQEEESGKKKKPPRPPKMLNRR